MVKGDYKTENTHCLTLFGSMEKQFEVKFSKDWVTSVIESLVKHTKLEMQPYFLPNGVEMTKHIPQLIVKLRCRGEKVKIKLQCLYDSCIMGERYYIPITLPHGII